MKKIFVFCAILLVLLTVAGLTGCGAGKQQQNQNNAETENASAPADTAASAASTPEETAQPASQEPSQTADSKTLVLYFSRTGEQYTVGVIEKGNTAIVAEMIAEKTGADTFEILPADDHYPMTYKELTDVAKREQNENARPAYAGTLPELSQYDTIFIGAPVWWGDWPMILYTVFENNDFSGKKLVPFSTHEGSGLSGFDKKLAAACPDCEILEGLAVRGNDAQNKQDDVRAAVNDWLTGLGY